MKNILTVVENFNCTGCGSCESICPTQCIKIEFDNNKGVNLPKIDSAKCIECEKCLKICPGENVDIPFLSKTYISGNQQNTKLGKYDSILLGNAIDQDTRYQGASGGLITALLHSLFNSKTIDGALVLSKNANEPFKPNPTIIRKADDLKNTQGSWYCPVSPNTAVKEIINQPGKYVVVGLPCQIHSIRKMQELNPVLKDRIIYCFGLFCQNNCTIYGSKFYFSSKDVNFSNITSIKYRAAGWPGKIEVTEKNTVKSFSRVASKPYERKIFDTAFHHNFTQPRCLVCRDLTNELADISFGDPHLREIAQTEKIGKSMLIVRSIEAQDIILRAIDNKYIQTQELKLETALKAQNFKHKATVSGRMIIWKMLGRTVPDYGENKKRKFTIRSLIRALKYAWSYFYSGKFYLKILFINKISINIKVFINQIISKILKK